MCQSYKCLRETYVFCSWVSLFSSCESHTLRRTHVFCSRVLLFSSCASHTLCKPHLCKPHSTKNSCLVFQGLTILMLCKPHSVYQVKFDFLGHACDLYLALFVCRTKTVLLTDPSMSTSEILKEIQFSTFPAAEHQTAFTLTYNLRAYM